MLGKFISLKTNTSTRGDKRFTIILNLFQYFPILLILTCAIVRFEFGDNCKWLPNDEKSKNVWESLIRRESEDTDHVTSNAHSPLSNNNNKKKEKRKRKEKRSKRTYFFKQYKPYTVHAPFLEPRSGLKDGLLTK